MKTGLDGAACLRRATLKSVRRRRQRNEIHDIAILCTGEFVMPRAGHHTQNGLPLAAPPPLLHNAQSGRADRPPPSHRLKILQGIDAGLLQVQSHPPMFAHP